jgi:hypothetical protein
VTARLIRIGALVMNFVGAGLLRFALSIESANRTVTISDGVTVTYNSSLSGLTPAVISSAHPTFYTWGWSLLIGGFLVQLGLEVFALREDRAAFRRDDTRHPEG